jgi:hypothetical protein
MKIRAFQRKHQVMLRRNIILSRCENMAAGRASGKIARKGPPRTDREA